MATMCIPVKAVASLLILMNFCCASAVMILEAPTILIQPLKSHLLFFLQFMKRRYVIIIAFLPTYFYISEGIVTGSLPCTVSRPYKALAAIRNAGVVNS
jgi:hypothetical protein